MSEPETDYALLDPHVELVRKRLLERSQFGIRKYGCTLDRRDLTARQWLYHLQDELLDAAVYSQRLICELARYEDDGK